MVPHDSKSYLPLVQSMINKLYFFSPKQRFDESQCSCLCLDGAAKQNCYNKPGSWYWNEATCQCMCKPAEEVLLQRCATGYRFDALNTCSCVIDHLIASPELIILVIILVFGLMTAAGTILFCHRQKIGIFKNQRRDHVLEKIRKSSAESQQEKKQPENQNQTALLIT